MSDTINAFEDAIKKIIQLPSTLLRVNLFPYENSLKLELHYYSNHRDCTFIFNGDEIELSDYALDLLASCNIYLKVWRPLNNSAEKLHAQLAKVGIKEIKYLSLTDSFEASCQLHDILFVNFNCRMLDIVASEDFIKEDLDILSNLLIRIHNQTIRHHVELSCIDCKFLNETRLALVKLGFSELEDEVKFHNSTDDFTGEFTLEIDNNAVRFVWSPQDQQWEYVEFSYDYDQLLL